MSVHKVHDFQKQLSIGEAAEAHLDAHFRLTHDIRRASEADQKRGIDRFLRRKGSTDSFAWTAVEYKADFKAGETGCFFVETSVNYRVQHKDYPTSDAPGWLHTTQADWLVLFIPYTGALYFVEPAKLRDLTELHGWKTGWCRNHALMSKGVLVPIGEVAKIGRFQLIERMEG